MKQYVGLETSLEETSVCVIDQFGEIVAEGKVASRPEAIAAFVREKAPGAVRIGLESGQLSTWHWHALGDLGLPVVCLDARHAKAALSMQINKTDRGDAAGLAQVVRLGWYREVQVKSFEAYRIRSVLGARAQLVRIKGDLENQIRGLFKIFGQILGQVGGARGRQGFQRRVEELLRAVPGLAPAICPLMGVHETVCRELDELNRQVRALAKASAPARRFMTVPGVGPVTALSFLSAVDDPARFRKSTSLGAYLGLTPRRYQSGEIDRAGRISKCGDRLARTCLYEAAGVLLTKVKRWSALKAWGMRLAKRIGAKKAKVALARKLAVILHCIWVDGTEFWWAKTEGGS